LKKAIKENGKPSLVNIDQSGANNAGLKQFNRTPYGQKTHRDYYFKGPNSLLIPCS
jgi:hypothetical protein